MLIYDRQRTKIVNLNAMQCLELKTHYAKGTYDVYCEAQEQAFLLGRYKSIDRAAVAMNEILKAYDKNERIFYMPQEQEEI